MCPKSRWQNPQPKRRLGGGFCRLRGLAPSGSARGLQGSGRGFGGLDGGTNHKADADAPRGRRLQTLNAPNRKAGRATREPPRRGARGEHGRNRPPEDARRPAGAKPRGRKRTAGGEGAPERERVAQAHTQGTSKFQITSAFGARRRGATEGSAPHKGKITTTRDINTSALGARRQAASVASRTHKNEPPITSGARRQGASVASAAHIKNDL